MPKARYVLLIEGKVQKGGFRSFVKKQALILGVTGYAENLPTGEVIVLLEGEEESIKKLIDTIEKEAPAFIEIGKITKRKEKYTGSFTDFERKGSDVLEGLEDKGVREILLSIASFSKSTDEKLEKGVEILGEIKTKQDEHIELTREILRKQDKHIELTSEISRKQDEHIELTKEILHETREMPRKQDEHIELTREILRKQDVHIGISKQILSKQDEHMEVTRKGFEDVAGELRGYHELHEEIRELREEFAKLKEALRQAGISVS